MTALAAVRAPDASTVRLEFANGSLGPGSQTVFFMLHSNATDDALDAVARIGASTLPTFAPAAPIPEPATWALTAVGLAGLVMLRRMRG